MVSRAGIKGASVSEKTAVVNGVILTEAQLREGLEQIEAASTMETDRVIRVGDSHRSTYINIPPAVVRDIVNMAEYVPKMYVTLYVTGRVGYNAYHRSVNNRPALKGFQS